MRKNYISGLVIIFLCLLSGKSIGQIKVTVATSATNLCVGNPAYTNIGNIVLTETGNNDFQNDNTSRTFILSAPTNFQFNPGTGSVAVGGANDFNSAPGIAVTATTITITYIVNANAQIDVMTISGVQARAINSGSFGPVMRTGGSANQNGNGNNTNIHAVMVSESQPVIAGLDNAYCQNDPADTIFSAPSNGVWSGTGVTTISPGVARFNPGVGGTGGRTITYTTSGGVCNTATNKNITVNGSPTGNITGLAANYTTNDPNVTLTGTGAPTGGSFTWFGPGVSNGSFYPNVAGAGSHVVSGVYMDLQGCKDTATQSVNVTSGGSFVAQITGLAPQYCVSDGAAHNIVGTPGLFSNGSAGTFSGPGITDLGNNLATFNAAAAGIGTHTVTYSYTFCLFGCSSTEVTEQVTVNALPSPYFYLYSTQCVATPAITLNGYPAGGTFSGTGITGPVGTQQFNPATAGIGGPYTITYVYTDPNTGCTNSTNGIYGAVTVINAPVPTITTTIATSYCTDNATPILLAGNPTNSYYYYANFQGSGVSYIYNTTTFAYDFYFTPSNASIGRDTIRYFYTDANGCQGQTFKLTDIGAPTSVNAGIDTFMCAGVASIQVKGTFGGGASSAVWGLSGGDGNFATQNIVGNTVTRTYTPGPTDIAAKSFNIVLTTDDPTGACLASSDIRNIKIVDLPIVSITNLPADRFCKTDPNFAMQGLAYYNYFYNGFVYTGYAGALNNFQVSPSTAAFVSPNFSPANANPTNYTLTYTYTDPNGCTNFNDTLITINESPVVKFDIDSGHCATRFTFFNPDSSIVPAATTVTYSWDFGDGATLADTSHLEYPKYKYQSAGGYPVSLTLRTNQGCSATKTLPNNKLLIIQTIPKTDFDFRFQCYGDLTLFDTLSTLQPGTFKSRTWLFATAKGGTPFTTIHQTASSATSYNFPDPGTYWVTAIDSTTLGCTDKSQKDVFILPYVIPTASQPYAISFKDSTGNWGQNGIRSSWVHDIPNPTNKPKMYYGGAGILDSVWVTSDTAAANIGLYRAGEKSHLHSPCVNFSQLDKPMIVVKLWSATQQQIAGAVLNVSTDNGLTWSTIGKLGDGVGWYNNIGIAGSPGTLSTNDGWSGIDTSWHEAKIGLPALANYTPAQKVRFKITFGAPSDSTIARSEGIAIDSVWIGNKNKVVLLEHFTNNVTGGATTPAISIGNNSMNGIRNLRSKDLAAVYYHTSFPASDPFNQFYSEGPSSRVLYYGVTGAPRSVLDGSYYNGSIYTGGTADSRIDITDVDARSLETAIYKLDMTTDFSPGLATVATEVTYIGKGVATADVTLHTVVIEDDTVGAVKYHAIARQMLPDAAGNYISRVWNTGDSLIFSHSWTHALPGTAVLGAVTFLQNVNTKEVYQTAYIRGSGTYGAPVIAGTADATEEFNVRMFPNPATDEVFLLYGKALRQASEWVVFDNIGREVERGICSQGKEGFSINTARYNGGVYHIKLKGENGAVAHKELVVIH